MFRFKPSQTSNNLQCVPTVWYIPFVLCRCFKITHVFKIYAVVYLKTLNVQNLPIPLISTGVHNINSNAFYFVLMQLAWVVTMLLLPSRGNF